MQNEPFQLGICMAGAVSAGAYTAGVLDCLLEALEGWEQKRGQAGVPTHRVSISVVGGASAGGVTGLLAAAAIQQPAAKILYKSWVEMEADSMAPFLLDTDDIAASQSLSSLLNGSFIERLSNRAIAAAGNPTNALPAYMDPAMKLFATMTNLAGYPYNISFQSDLQKTIHQMSVHHDFACFQLAGSQLTASLPGKAAAQLTDPGWIPLNLCKGINANLLQQAILATSAFPLVLKPILFKRPRKFIQENPWLNQQGLLLDSAADHVSLQVDGGLMNNEPFEKVRELLQEKAGGFASRSVSKDSFSSFTNTVLMIDPFPESTGFKETDSGTVTGVAKQILFAMMHQMKSKPLPIADMMNKEKAGQFLIAPVRYQDSPKERIEGARAIASGSLQGFGGFLRKSFREHDYALGQYNCLRFLQNHFTVPLKQFHQHPLFSKGYAEIDLQSFLCEKKESVQIIPLFKMAKPMPQWPATKTDFIDELRPGIQKRSAAILSVVSSNWFRKRLLQLSGHLFVNRYVANSLLRQMHAGLKAHQLCQ